MLPKPYRTLYQLISLRQDQENSETIDDSIRAGVRVAGTNLWVLVFAILIASVGLNVNSTAVIIGAMLISPLMGPIVGIGYAAAVHDFELIKLALRNLFIFTLISLITSTLYFYLSPLEAAQSELLSRTTPTLWDVLIAFFGGCAGMIALTRKSMSNVVPGVAIATALMPPLCTAGFGLATGRWEFFAGALFLYTINSVFISFATLSLAKLMRLPKRAYVNQAKQLRARIIIATAIFGTIAPSAYLAYRFVQGQFFSTAAERVILSLKKDGYVVLEKGIDPLRHHISLTLAGKTPPADLTENLQQQLSVQGVDNASINIRHTGSQQVDIGSIKTELRQDLYASMAAQIETLRQQNTALTEREQERVDEREDQQTLIAELQAQYPDITHAAVADGVASASAAAPADAPSPAAVAGSLPDGVQNLLSGENVTLVAITSRRKLGAADRQRIAAWMRVRLHGRQFDILYNTVQTSELTLPSAEQPPQADAADTRRSSPVGNRHAKPEQKTGTAESPQQPD